MNLEGERLREEIRNITKMIEEGMADIRRKEEEIVQSEVLFQKEREQSILKEKEFARLESARLDRQYEEDQKTIGAQLHEVVVWHWPFP